MGKQCGLGSEEAGSTLFVEEAIKTFHNKFKISKLLVVLVLLYVNCK